MAEIDGPERRRTISTFRSTTEASAPSGKQPTLATRTLTWHAFAQAVSSQHPQKHIGTAYQLQQIKFTFADFTSACKATNDVLIYPLLATCETFGILSSSTDILFQLGSAPVGDSLDQTVSLLDHFKVVSLFRLLFALKTLGKWVDRAVASLPFFLCGGIQSNRVQTDTLFRKLVTNMCTKSETSTLYADRNKLLTWEFSAFFECLNFIQKELAHIKVISDAEGSSHLRQPNWKEIVSHFRDSPLRKQLSFDDAKKECDDIFISHFSNQVSSLDDKILSARNRAVEPLAYVSTALAVSSSHTEWNNLYWNKVPIQLANAFSSNKDTDAFLFPLPFDARSYDAMFAVSDSALVLANNLVIQKISTSLIHERIAAYKTRILGKCTRFLDDETLQRIADSIDEGNAYFHIPSKLRGFVEMPDDDDAPFELHTVLTHGTFEDILRQTTIKNPHHIILDATAISDGDGSFDDIMEPIPVNKRNSFQSPNATKNIFGRLYSLSRNAGGRVIHTNTNVHRHAPVTQRGFGNDDSDDDMFSIDDTNLSFNGMSPINMGDGKKTPAWEKKSLQRKRIIEEKAQIRTVAEQPSSQLLSPSQLKDMSKIERRIESAAGGPLSPWDIAQFTHNRRAPGSVPKPTTNSVSVLNTPAAAVTRKLLSSGSGSRLHAAGLSPMKHAGAHITPETPAKLFSANEFRTMGSPVPRLSLKMTGTTSAATATAAPSTAATATAASSTSPVGPIVSPGSSAAAPTTVVAPAAVASDPSDAAPAAVASDPSDAAPAAVASDPSDAAPAAVVAPTTVAAPAAVAADPSAATPAAVVAPTTVAAPAAVVAPTTVAAPAAVVAPTTVAAPAAVVAPTTVAAPAAVAADPSAATPAAVAADPSAATPAAVVAPTTVAAPAAVASDPSAAADPPVVTPTTVGASDPFITAASSESNDTIDERVDNVAKLLQQLAANTRQIIAPDNVSSTAFRHQERVLDMVLEKLEETQLPQSNANNYLKLATTESHVGTYWTSQLNYILQTLSTLADAITKLETETLKILERACAMYADAIRVGALATYFGYFVHDGELPDTGAVTNADGEAVMVHAYRVFLECLDDLESMFVQNNIVTGAAQLFAEASNTHLEEIRKLDGFLELHNLGTLNRNDVWRLQAQVLHTRQSHRPVPNNYRDVIVGTMRVLRDHNFASGDEIDDLCVYSTWLTDPAHVVVNLNMFFSELRLKECAKRKHDKFSTALARHESLCDAIRFDGDDDNAQHILRNMIKMLGNLDDAPAHGSLREIALSSAFKKQLDKEMKRDVQCCNERGKDIFDLLRDVHSRAHTIYGKSFFTMQGQINDGATTLAEGKCEFSAGIDEIIRAKLPLNVVSTAAGGQGTNPRVSLPNPDDDDDGSQPDDNGRAPGGGGAAGSKSGNNNGDAPDPDPDADAVELPFDPDAHFETWNYSEYDMRAVWKASDIDKASLVHATGLRDLQFAKNAGLLTMTDETPEKVNVAFAESRLVSGSSSNAAWINSSLLVQFLTALVAYGVDELFLDLDDSTFKDHTLIDIMQCIRDRMQVSLDSDLLARIAASVVTYARYDVIHRVVIELTSAYHDENTMLQCRRLWTSNDMDKSDNTTWVREQTKNLFDLAIWDELAYIVDGKNNNPKYVVVEFCSRVTGDNDSFPTLEDMRNLHRHLLQKSTDDNDYKLFPLCYGYSLPTGRKQYTTYRVIDATHQIREQCVARVHFALFTLSKSAAFKHEHRVLHDMPTRACVLCGFVRSSTDIPHAVFEEHIYAPWYRCAAEQFFDLSPVLTILGADDRPRSGFYKTFVEPLHLDQKLAALFVGAMKSQQLKSIVEELERSSEDKPNESKLVGIDKAFVELMTIPIVPSQQTTMFNVLRTDCNVPDSAAADVIALIAARIKTPIGRLVALLRRGKKQMTSEAYKSALLLNQQRGLLADGGNNDQRTGTKRLLIFKLFVMRVCQMVLFNIPMRFLKSAENNVDDDDNSDIPPTLHINDKMSIAGAIMKASNRPASSTIDFFQNYPSVTEIANDNDPSIIYYDYRRTPPERPEIGDIAVPGSREDAAEPAVAAATGGGDVALAPAHDAADASGGPVIAAAAPASTSEHDNDESSLIVESIDELDKDFVNQSIIDAFGWLPEIGGDVRAPTRIQTAASGVTIDSKTDKPLRLLQMNFQDALFAP